MNAVKKIFLGFVILLLLLLIIDQQLYRSYFLSKITPHPEIGQMNNSEGQIKYQIQKLENRTIRFELQNSSLLPKFIFGYRNDELRIKSGFDLIFDNASRKNWQTDYKIKKSHPGFDCGTGLGIFSINSFEKISKEESYSEFLSRFHIRDLIIEKDSNGYDIIYGEPLLVRKRDGEQYVAKDISILESDSIEVQFYLPTYSIFNGKQTNNYSNSIKVSYLDLLAQYMEK
jgi:hypothetical protein